MTLITKTYVYGDDDLTSFDYDDETAIRGLLLGHRITKIADDHLELDDGTVVKVVPNEGCGGCSAGGYDLDVLNGCDNIITRVDFVVEFTDGDDWESEKVYKVFVVAEDKRINLYAVSGDDGNGYYGTGYWLLIRYAADKETTT